MEFFKIKMKLNHCNIVLLLFIKFLNILFKCITVQNDVNINIIIKHMPDFFTPKAPTPLIPQTVRPVSPSK